MSDLTDLPRCSVCNRPMRAYNAVIADHPETVGKGSGGKCVTHYKRDMGKSYVRYPAVNKVAGRMPERLPLTPDEQTVLANFASRFDADPELADMLGLVLS